MPLPGGAVTRYLIPIDGVERPADAVPEYVAFHRADGSELGLQFNSHLSLKYDYGAVGDGVTDDTAAVQAWLSAALSTGRIAYADPGVYLVTAQVAVTLTSDRSLTIRGVGRGNATGSASRFLLGAALASNDTAMIQINGASQSGFVDIEGIELRGASLTGTGMKVTDLSARCVVRRCWFQNFLGRGFWHYSGIGIYIDTTHCEGNATGIEIGGTTSIGEGAIVACKFASNTTRNVMLNTGATFLSFIGCTIYGEAAPEESIGVEMAAGVVGVGFYQCNFENSVPALYAPSGNITQLTVQGCTINPRNLTGAGTKYGIDISSLGYGMVQGNVFTGSCSSGGTLVGMRISTTSTENIIGPNQFSLTGAGTTTKYSLPDGAAATYGVGINGATVALAAVRQTYYHTHYGADTFEMANDAVVVLDRMYTGRLEVSAGVYWSDFYCYNGTITEGVGAAAQFTTTKDNAATFNVYYEGGVVKLQNKTGATVDVQPIFTGRR